MSRRIIGSILGVVFVTLLLTGIGTLLLARVANTRDDLARLEQKAVEASGLLVAVDQSLGRPDAATRPGVAVAVNRLRRQLSGALAVSGIGIAYIGPAGRIVGELPEGVVAEDLDAEVLARGGAVSGRRRETLWAAAAATETLRSGREGVLVTVLTQPRETLVGPTLRWFLWSAVIALAVGALASVALGRRLGRPLRAAVDATSRIAHGDLTARLEPPADESEDELADLARSVNAMADALERARAQERQFLMSVSHDLRTPLTSIRGYAEAISDGAIDDPRRGAEIILRESRRLERLVGDLLDLARIDADRFHLVLVPADLVDIVAGTVAGFAPELRDAGVDLHQSPDAIAPIVARVDVDRLSQVVSNLVANAITFSATTVWTDVRVVGDEAWIQVSDDGVGISPESLPHVFERHYQADNQPTRRGPNAGVGLAIVAELVARMDGRCEASSVDGSGTTFTVRFPLA